jgi:hypothetical protein
MVRLHLSLCAVGRHASRGWRLAARRAYDRIGGPGLAPVPETRNPPMCHD